MFFLFETFTSKTRLIFKGALRLFWGEMILSLEGNKLG